MFWNSYLQIIACRFFFLLLTTFSKCVGNICLHFWIPRLSELLKVYFSSPRSFCTNLWVVGAGPAACVCVLDIGVKGTCNLISLKICLVCSFLAVPIIICFYVRDYKANKASLFCPIQNPNLLDLPTCSSNLFV